jgi:hypothetical protein
MTLPLDARATNPASRAPSPRGEPVFVEITIPDLEQKAQAMCREIIEGTGTLGRRMRARNTEPLRKELLERTPHPLLIAQTKATEAALPSDIFFRDDGKTPYVYHSYRSALLLQDYFINANVDLSLEEQAVLLSITLGHDDIEEPQEYLIKPKHADKRQHGRTQEQSKFLFDRIMEEEEIPHSLSSPVYVGISLLNRWNSDNSKRNNKEYMDTLIEAGLAWVKAADMDSAHGDMARIVGEAETLIERGEFALPADLDPLFARLEQSTKKVEDDLQKNLGAHVPEYLREQFVITCRAGKIFRGELEKKLAAEKTHRETLSGSRRGATTVFEADLHS